MPVTLNQLKAKMRQNPEAQKPKEQERKLNGNNGGMQINHSFRNQKGKAPCRMHGSFPCLVSRKMQITLCWTENHSV